MATTNKLKVLNDPVHGFIRIPDSLTFDVIQHPYFQRLRRIKQLGLTEYVYPGAVHTRFHHALGAFHLMQRAIRVLRFKGVSITAQEEQAAGLAILLHDIGHGPFSHTLEHSLVKGVSHEYLSERFMQALNASFQNKLHLAIQIFLNQHSKPFLHQLVSGQLDVDRLDYLARDSYFTGVSEGIVNFDRIIDMMHVQDGQLVVEEKAKYSLEKFLVSRRLMYWQVYLHKTAVCAEEMLIRVIRLARKLYQEGQGVDVPGALHHFFTEDVTGVHFQDDATLHQFAQLDDYDIIMALKQWQHHAHPILSRLSKALIERKLFRIELLDAPPSANHLESIQNKVAQSYSLPEDQAKWLVWHGRMSNYLYNPKLGGIRILRKDGTVKDLATINDQWTADALQREVSKYFLVYPKNIVTNA